MAKNPSQNQTNTKQIKKPQQTTSEQNNFTRSKEWPNMTKTLCPHLMKRQFPYWLAEFGIKLQSIDPAKGMFLLWEAMQGMPIDSGE